MTDVKDAVKAYLGEIGRKGGAAGTGSKKRRSREHYKRIARISAERRRNKAKQKQAEEKKDE